MRHIRLALSCAASALALVALSTGTAFAADPDDDPTISLVGITIGGGTDADADVELVVDLGLGDDDADDADVEIDIGGQQTSVVDVAVDLALETAGTGTPAENRRSTAAAPVDVDADVDAVAKVQLGPDRGPANGITGLVRVPAALGANALGIVHADAVADLCLEVAVFAAAPQCPGSSATENPAQSTGGGLTALVDAATSVGAIVGDLAGAGVEADACVGIGIWASAPGCVAATGPDDETPDGDEPDGTPNDPDGSDPDGSDPDGEGAAPDEDDQTGPTRPSQLPDTALGGPAGFGPGAILLVLLTGVVLAHRWVPGRESSG